LSRLLDYKETKEETKEVILILINEARIQKFTGEWQTSSNFFKKMSDEVGI
jgi:hypothetical protein